MSVIYNNLPGYVPNYDEKFLSLQRLHTTPTKNSHVKRPNILTPSQRYYDEVMRDYDYETYPPIIPYEEAKTIDRQ
jgi:hypothetical protein